MAIVFATLWLAYFVYSQGQLLQDRFHVLHYFLLSLSFLCVTAFGNIHNDLCDIETDRLNKGNDRIIGQAITKSMAVWWAVAFYVDGLLLALVYSFLHDEFRFAAFYILFSSLLIVYNKKLKCLPVIGNLVVALLCGCVILTPIVIASLGPHHTVDQLQEEVLLLVSFAFFAFVINFLRELVKDLEDLYGDAQTGCKTLPVAVSVRFSHIVVLVISLFFLFALICFGYFILVKKSMLIGLVLTVMLVMPFYFFYHTMKTSDYEKSQSWLKIEMLLGLLALIIFAIL